MYKITINNKDYSSWEICDNINLSIIQFDQIDNPANFKLFNNDIFSFDTGKFSLDHSPTRLCKNIPCVLLLQDNKTYGRQSSTKNNQGKLFYKCVPNDTHLPSFIVPYDNKNIGFSKVFTNLYVTISFNSWKEKHPQGIINQIIGPVDVLENFYEYQLYCKELNISIQKLNKDTHKSIDNRPNNTIVNEIFSNSSDKINNRTSSFNVFSIDPQGSKDFDDAFSIKNIADDKICVSIYISNVPLILNALNLWGSISKRTTTIYLPDKKRPMLPHILSDELCSLQCGEDRLSFVLDIVFDRKGTILSHSFANAKIKVVNNFVYEEDDLLDFPDYQNLFDFVKIISEKYKYSNDKIVDSHDVVSYLMILMNYYCAKEFINFGNGIFRKTIQKSCVDVDTNVDDIDVVKFIRNWNSFSCIYTDLNSKKDIDLSHHLMSLDAYVHITSPIRRVVDLLNMMKLQINLGLGLDIENNKNATEFYNKWIGNIEYINKTMKSVKRIQSDCELLSLCSKHKYIIDKIYTGYVFDKNNNNNNNLSMYKYNVYLPELKMVSHIKCQLDMKEFEKCSFKLYIFNNEEKFKKKIRLQIVTIDNEEKN